LQNLTTDERITGSQKINNDFEFLIRAIRREILLCELGVPN